MTVPGAECWQVLLATVKSVEVTGLASEADSRIRAEYSFVYSLTELGTELSKLSPIPNLPFPPKTLTDVVPIEVEKKYNRSALFKLYDDGWRLYTVF